MKRQTRRERLAAQRQDVPQPVPAAKKGSFLPWLVTSSLITAGVYFSMVDTSQDTIAAPAPVVVETPVTIDELTSNGKYSMDNWTVAYNEYMDEVKKVASPGWCPKLQLLSWECEKDFVINNPVMLGIGTSEEAKYLRTKYEEKYNVRPGTILRIACQEVWGLYSETKYGSDREIPVELRDAMSAAIEKELPNIYPAVEHRLAQVTQFPTEDNEPEMYIITVPIFYIDNAINSNEGPMLSRVASLSVVIDGAGIEVVCNRVFDSQDPNEAWFETLLISDLLQEEIQAELNEDVIEEDFGTIAGDDSAAVEFVDVVDPAVAQEAAWEEYQAEVKKRVEEFGSSVWYPQLNEISKNLTLVQRDMLGLMNLMSTSEEAFEVRALIQDKHQTGPEFCLLAKATIHLWEIAKKRAVVITKNKKLGPFNHISPEVLEADYNRTKDTDFGYGSITDNWGTLLKVEGIEVRWDLALISHGYGEEIYVTVPYVTPFDTTHVGEVDGLHKTVSVAWFTLTKSSKGYNFEDMSRGQGGLYRGRGTQTPMEALGDCVEGYE